MDLAALVAVVQQEQQPDLQQQQRQPGHVGRREALWAGRLRLRRMVSRQAKGLQRQVTAAEFSYRVQAQASNRSGRARTEDHVLPVDKAAKRFECKGKGGWKKWTPDAILRGGFSPGSMSSREAASQMEGASPSGILMARLFIAECIEEGQNEYHARILHRLEQAGDGSGSALDFALVNVMFDETELDLNLGSDGEASWSVLASHSQITLGGHGEVIDFDAVRAPCVLPTKKAATMWPVLSKGIGGLWPGVISMNASMRAVLVTCDAGTANIKLLKHLCACLPNNISLVTTLCAQHRNGNVIERATKLLGILPGCFAVAKSMKQGSWMRSIGQHVQTVLADKLIVVPEEPVGLEEEWARSRVAVKALLDLVALNCPKGEDEQPARGLSTAVSEFMKFFRGPWTGPRPCACAGGTHHVLDMI